MALPELPAARLSSCIHWCSGLPASPSDGLDAMKFLLRWRSLRARTPKQLWPPFGPALELLVSSLTSLLPLMVPISHEPGALHAWTGEAGFRADV